MSRLARKIPATAAFLTASLLGSLSALGAAVDDRTLEEFKKYVAEKTGGRLSDTQLDALAKMVDKDGDGLISDAEFAGRMAALQRVMSGESAPAVRPSAKPVSIPAFTGSGKATILLITGDEIATAWKPFAEWKTRLGKAVKIVTLSQIESGYAAAGVQEKIRQCVRDHVDNHATRWVVLGGDSLPGGKGLVPGGHTTVHPQERRGIPTDIVYLSATDWDADADGIHGEWEEDREAISYPDGSVGLGRVPVRTAADVEAFTEKVIAYESRYPTGDFAMQMIYTCTDAPAYPKVRKSWDGYLSKVWKGGKVGRFFSRETPWDEEGKPGSHQLSAENLVELINSRTIGKLHIHGHGFLPVWILERSKFTAEHVGQLAHDGAYPLITTVSCFTGQYDGEQDPSIVEAMIRRPKGGSVAIVAPVRTGKPHFHQRSDFRLMVTEGKLDGTTQTMTRYWSNGLGGGMTTGEAFMKAKAAMAPDARKTAGYHLCICELNLLGDPTLDMRATIPRTPRLEAPAGIAIGEQSLRVVTDAPGGTVCVWKGMEVYEVATAGADGTAAFRIAPSSRGELLVAVSGADLNAVSAIIEVRPMH